MMILYKFVIGWLLPPGIFIIACAYGAWLLRRKENGKRAHVFYIMCSIASGLYIFSISPFLHVFSSGLSVYPTITHEMFRTKNAVIVLSGGIHENVPMSFSSLNAAPSEYGVVRLVEAVRLYRKIIDHGDSCMIILTGGVFFGNIHAESDVYKEWLISMGIPECDIVSENKSKTTYENALYVRPLVETHNAGSVFLVTSSLHMQRSVRVFKKFGMNVIPATCDVRGEYRFSLLSLVPDAGVLNDTRMVMWEYIGMIFYALKG